MANRARGRAAEQFPPDPEAPTSAQPLVLPVAEAAATLGVSDDLIYQLTDRGELPCLRVGRRKVIPRQAVEALVNKAMYPFDNG